MISYLEKLARGVTTIDEHCAIFPECLPMFKALEETTMEQREKMENFSDHFSLCQSLEMTVVDLPKFLEHRATRSCPNQRWPPCTCLAVDIRPSEVREGVGRVKSNEDQGIVLESITDWQLEDVRPRCRWLKQIS